MAPPKTEKKTYAAGSSGWRKLVSDKARAAFTKADKTRSDFLDLQGFIEAVEIVVGDVVCAEELLHYFMKGDLAQNGRIYMHAFVKIFVNDIAKKRLSGNIAV